MTESEIIREMLDRITVLSSDLQNANCAAYLRESELRELREQAAVQAAPAVNQRPCFATTCATHDLMVAIAQGHRISAVKAHSEVTGMGLKDSMEAVAAALAWQSWVTPMSK